MLLERIGFTPEEIYYGQLLSDGRILVPAVVAGETALFLLYTTQRLDLTIDLGFARKRDWPYERRTNDWGLSPLTDFFALGSARQHETVVVQGSEEDGGVEYITAGRLGTLYVNQGVMAIDPVAAAVGVARSLEPPVLRGAGGVCVDLVAGTLDRLPVTANLRDKSAPVGAPRFMLHTGRDLSVISLDYIERSWGSARRRKEARRAHERSRPVRVWLRLPDDTTVDMEMLVGNLIEPDYVDTLGSGIDGYLGLDFLYRWLPLIDFPNHALWLVPLDADVRT